MVRNVIVIQDGYACRKRKKRKKKKKKMDSCRLKHFLTSSNLTEILEYSPMKQTCINNKKEQNE